MHSKAKNRQVAVSRRRKQSDVILKKGRKGEDIHAEEGRGQDLAYTHYARTP